MSESSKPLVIEHAEQLWSGSSRRQFLKALGIGGAVVLLPSVFTACSDDDNDLTGINGGPVTLDLSNDTGILNYAYALEQLEAGFYTAVVASSIFGTMTAEQQEVLADLRNHEVIHREFFRGVLGSNRIGDLALSSSAVATATSSIASVFKTSETFEDLGVSAYNGAGKYLKDAGNLLLAGKIVSVEARHASAIRDIREAMGVTNSAPRFAGDDVVSPTTGLDVKLEPSSVLSRVGASGFVTTSISLTNVPAGTPDAGPPNPTP